MPGLFSSLAVTANSLGAYEKLFDTVSNNINNATTPGYAKQKMTTLPMPFDPAGGMPGGIMDSDLENSRSDYAERSVWNGNSNWGNADQFTTEMSNIEKLFDVTGDTGLPNQLNQFFQTLSSLAQTPNDSVARSTVLDRADQLANEFNSVATGLNNETAQLSFSMKSTAATINNIASQVASINKQIRNDFSARNDPSVSAQMYNNLEQLSEYGDFSILHESDGTVSVMLGGQTALVSGDQANLISVDTSTGSAVLEDARGNDITSQLHGGRLKAMIDMSNTELPALTDSMNQMAAGLADAVNGVLETGLDANGAAGTAMFSYNLPSDAAFTIKLTGITADQLAAATADAPGGNGNALLLNKLGTSPQIDGMTYMQYYSQIASRVGQDLNGAKETQQTQSELLSQARSVRSSLQSVDLNEEATQLVEYQRAYQAIAKVVTTLNDLTQVTMDMMR